MSREIGRPKTNYFDLKDKNRKQIELWNNVKALSTDDENAKALLVDTAHRIDPNNTSQFDYTKKINENINSLIQQYSVVPQIRNDLIRTLSDRISPTDFSKKIGIEKNIITNAINSKNRLSIIDLKPAVSTCFFFLL